MQEDVIGVCQELCPCQGACVQLTYAACVEGRDVNVHVINGIYVAKARLLRRCLIGVP